MAAWLQWREGAATHSRLCLPCVEISNTILNFQLLNLPIGQIRVREADRHASTQSH